jgi:hypothetical protein
MKILLVIILFFVFSCQKTDYLYFKNPILPDPTAHSPNMLKQGPTNLECFEKHLGEDEDRHCKPTNSC